MDTTQPSSELSCAMDHKYLAELHGNLASLYVLLMISSRLKYMRVMLSACTPLFLLKIMTLYATWPLHTSFYRKCCFNKNRIWRVRNNEPCDLLSELSVDDADFKDEEILMGVKSDNVDERNGFSAS